jgi:L-threonylcarbamoyladenylate synthase
VIAVPTDTVYGLVCDFEDYDAINKIFELKKRSSEKPLIAFCNSIQTIQSICENIPEVFYKIADKFFPGPLTIVLKKRSNIPDYITCGFNTIGIRIPDNQFLLKLLNVVKSPLASTSANISGEQSPISAKQIFDTFNNSIPLIIDGGLSKLKIESTVIDISDGNLKILRESSIKKDELLEFWK